MNENNNEMEMLLNKLSELRGRLPENEQKLLDRIVLSKSEEDVQAHLLLKEPQIELNNNKYEGFLAL